MKPFLTAFAALALCLLTLVPTTAQEKSVKPGINKPFENPDLKDFLQKFEGESREIAANAKEIVAACKLKPGMVVADVGAGTGLFTRKFAAEVGEKGKVFAVDICPELPSPHREDVRGSQDQERRDDPVRSVLDQAAEELGRSRLHLRHLPPLRVSATNAAIHP